MWRKHLEAVLYSSCLEMAVLRHQFTSVRNRKAENSKLLQVCKMTSVWISEFPQQHFTAFSALLFFFFKDVSTLVQCTSQNERLSFESKCIFLWCWTWTPHSSDNDETLFSVVCFSSFQQPSTWNMIRTAELINYPYFYLFSVEVVAKHGDKFF